MMNRLDSRLTVDRRLIQQLKNKNMTCSYHHNVMLLMLFWELVTILAKKLICNVNTP